MFTSRVPEAVQLLMKRSFAVLIALLAAPLMWGQAWQSIAPTGTAQPQETNWTNVVYDYQHKTLLLTQDDSGGQLLLQNNSGAKTTYASTVKTECGSASVTVGDSGGLSVSVNGGALEVK